MRLTTLIFVAGLGALAACGPAPVETAPEAVAVVEAPEPPPVPDESEMQRIAPRLSEADYEIRPVGSLKLDGPETIRQIGELMETRLSNPEGSEGNYRETMEIEDNGSEAVLVFTKSGLADDSVAAEQHVVEAKRTTPATSEVTGYGVRYQCARAPDPAAWTKGPCS